MKWYTLFPALTLFALPMFPFFDIYSSTLDLALLFGVLTASWDVLAGFTNYFNLGQAFMFGLGAYTSALLSVDWGATIPETMAASTLVSAIMGLLIGIPSLRIKGPYFSIFTLSLPLLFEQLTFIFPNQLGGERGIFGVHKLSHSLIGSYYATLVFALASLLVLYVIGASGTGLILKALGEDEDAVRANGLNPTTYKIFGFVISSVFAGLSGSVYANVFGFVEPMLFSYSVSLSVVVMGVLGGLGTIAGPFYAAFLVELLPPALGVGQTEATIIMTIVVMILLIRNPSRLHRIIRTEKVKVEAHPTKR